MEVIKEYLLYDKEGFFIGTSEVIEGVEAPENATLKRWEEPCFKPQFVDGEWKDAARRRLHENFPKLLKRLEAEEAKLLEGEPHE